MDLERTELAAREAIRDLVARYTWAGDRGDAAGVAACFTVDGVLDVGDHGGRWEGRDRIEAELRAVATRVATAGRRPGPVQHHVSSVLIELAGPAAATVRSYFAVHTVVGLDHWGRYRDRVVRSASDGAWCFVERVVRVDGSSAESVVVGQHRPAQPEAQAFQNER